MPFMPGPGAGDDFVQVIVLRLPAEFTFDLFRRSNQDRRISGPARLFDGWDAVSRDLSRGLDHLADGITVAASKIVDHLVPVLEIFKRKQVRRHEIRDVDVVADAASIRGRIIGAENADRLALP